MQVHALGASDVRTVRTGERDLHRMHGYRDGLRHVRRVTERKSVRQPDQPDLRERGLQAHQGLESPECLIPDGGRCGALVRCGDGRGGSASARRGDRHAVRRTPRNTQQNEASEDAVGL